MKKTLVSTIISFTLIGFSAVMLASCSGSGFADSGIASDEIYESSNRAGSLVWSDEFNGGSLNGGAWNCETGAGGWGNNELQNYTNRWNNVRVENGNLVITAQRENYYGSQWTSARINTKGKKEFKYGRVTARMKMPKGQGVWPAFWMLGADISWNNWPRCGEIDIMEHVSWENTVHGTAHWDANGGHAQYGNSTQNNKYWTKFDVDVTQWHEYSIDWRADKIRWYVDGRQYMEFDIAGGKNSTEEFHKPYYILFNLAIGGSWPGYPDGSTPSTNKMYVDYVRVYN